MKYSQTFSIYACIIAIHFFTKTNGCGKPAYSELEAMGAACSPNDTCTVPRDDDKDNLDNYRCQCRAACIKSNTCCIDSDFASLATVHNRLKTGTCQRVFKTNRDVIMVSKCESRWRGNNTKVKCESPTLDMSDPIGMTPVTNTNSETTYSNYFCAACNRDMQFLELWDIKINKHGPSPSLTDNEVDKNKLFSELVYNDTAKTWSLQSQDSMGNFTSERVTITFDLPQRLKKMVTKCSTSIVSECHSNWTDEKIRHKCHSYMGIVYLKSDNFGVVAYRNIHCALCNYESFSSDSVCDVHKSMIPAASPPLSFTFLLDVNLHDGDKVGEINRCGKGKIYDPFFDKCRVLICKIPGYIIKGDKCVPPS